MCAHMTRSSRRLISLKGQNKLCKETLCLLGPPKLYPLMLTKKRLKAELIVLYLYCISLFHLLCKSDKIMEWSSNGTYGSKISISSSTQLLPYELKIPINSSQTIGYESNSKSILYIWIQITILARKELCLG